MASEDNPMAGADNLKKIVEAIKRNPNLDKSSIRIILSKLKALRTQLHEGHDHGGDINEDDILKQLDSDLSEGMDLKSRQTWVPTFHEYIVFFVMLIFIIAIFGNITRKITTNILFQSSSEFLMDFWLFLSFSLIAVFFGYKLYKSLTERQRKREEKQKAKQLKSKKK